MVMLEGVRFREMEECAFSGRVGHAVFFFTGLAMVASWLMILTFGTHDTSTNLTHK